MLPRDTYTCAQCLLPVATAAREPHERRHEDFTKYGKRRNVWTPADRKWLAQTKISLEGTA